MYDQCSSSSCWSSRSSFELAASRLYTKKFNVSGSLGEPEAAAPRSCRRRCVRVQTAAARSGVRRSASPTAPAPMAEWVRVPGRMHRGWFWASAVAVIGRESGWRADVALCPAVPPSRSSFAGGIATTEFEDANARLPAFGMIPSVGRPLAERYTEFPFVAKRVDNPPQSPPMLVANPRSHDCASRRCLLDDAIWVLDHKQCPARRPPDRLRAEAVHARVCRYHPEQRLANRELHDDVISIPYSMKHPGIERRHVERDSGARAVNPQLRLNPAHRINRKRAGFAPAL